MPTADDLEIQGEPTTSGRSVFCNDARIPGFSKIAQTSRTVTRNNTSTREAQCRICSGSSRTLVYRASVQSDTQLRKSISRAGVFLPLAGYNH